LEKIESNVRQRRVQLSKAQRCTASAGFAFAFVFLQLILAAQMADAQTFTVLYSFQGGNDGSGPLGNLLLDANGNVYGTTQYGGIFGYGAVFEVDASGTETLLHNFTGNKDGGYPWAGLIQDASGNLYSTTAGGGEGGNGTIFRLDAEARETVLWDFTGSDGAGPRSALFMDSPQGLYGTTLGGGGHGAGTVFELDEKGNESVLYSFREEPDAAYPSAGLFADAKGNLYGTTVAGGAFGNGAVFKLNKSGREKVLYSFHGSDGVSPWASLVGDELGNVYGTTNEGGDYSCYCGVVFKINPTGEETVLHRFKGPDGAYPYSGVTIDASGNLYGTAELGGTSDAGVVFKVDATTGKETVLYNFTGGTDGAYPFGGVILDAAGNLYGTAEYGGTTFNGTVFKLTP